MIRLVKAICARIARATRPRRYVICEDPDQLGYWIEER